MSRIVDHQTLLSKIANLNSAKKFDAVALDVFRYQAVNNHLYAQFLDLLSIKVPKVKHPSQIPFLPISLFKNHLIKTGNWANQFTFSSSGTTGQIPSQHHLRSRDWYKKISFSCFESFYGPVSDYCILALLPSYLERGGSSLVFMINEFIEASSFSQSGFFLNHEDQLSERLQECKSKSIPVLLIGVSFALLDFAEARPQDLSHCVIMETGGMKGRRKELTRAELHHQLTEAFQTKTIHSEYGMTELLSQAYSKKEGVFLPGPSMRIYCREMTDPFQLMPTGRSGVLNIIDLANLDTCAFIATDDIGKVYENGSFEVLGRMDNSDIRGCSLMIES